jgi:energy-coupling factor transport system substrate-specific component
MGPGLKQLLDGRGLFKTHELITIGLFAAGSRAATLTVALLGGGMNPVSMIVRSAVHSALLLVLLAKVPRTGALTLANLVGGLLAFLLMGQAMMTLPAVVVATALVELSVRLAGGLERRPRLALPLVVTSELLIRCANVGISLLAFREQRAMAVMVVAISAFSYLGILLGLVGGVRMVKELRRAGLVG